MNNIASPERVKSLIEKYYANIEDEPSSEIRTILEGTDLVKEFRATPLDKDQLFSDMFSKADEYENKLQEIIDLTCILDDSNLQFRDKETYEAFVNYLISNSPDLLLDISFLFHWLCEKYRQNSLKPSLSE